MTAEEQQQQQQQQQQRGAADDERAAPPAAGAPSAQATTSSPAPEPPTPPTPEELHAILNRDYDVTRVSPLTLKLESPGPPRAIIVVQTAAQLTLPERRMQVRLPDEMVPDILAPAVQADNEARARKEGQGGGGDNSKNGQQP